MTTVCRGNDSKYQHRGRSETDWKKSVFSRLSHWVCGILAACLSDPLKWASGIGWLLASGVEGSSPPCLISFNHLLIQIFTDTEELTHNQKKKAQNAQFSFVWLQLQVWNSVLTKADVLLIEFKISN